MRDRPPSSSPIRLEDPLETQYRNHVEQNETPKTRMYIWIGISVFLAFTAADWYMVNQHFKYALATRLITTAILATLLFVHTKYSRSYDGRNTLMGIGASIANLAIIFIALLAFEEHQYSYHYGTVLVLAAIFGILRMPFWHSLFTSVNIVLIYLGAIGTYFYMEDDLRLASNSPVHHWLNSLMVCVAFTFIGLLAVYRRESLKRILFRQYLKMERQVKHEQEKSERDQLTRGYNRRYYDRVLEEWCSSRNAGDEIISLMYIDIDLFKPCNDRLGYDYGDYVLCTIHQILQSVVDESTFEGFAARRGGDEFVVVLKSASQEQAQELVDTISTKIYNRKISCGIEDKRVTVSVGLITDRIKNNSDRFELETRASHRMQEAKSHHYQNDGLH